jgi:hypothetical protein
VTWRALVCLGIILVLAGEAVALGLLHRRTGRGPPPRSMLPMLGAGGALVLAMLVLVLSGPGVAWLACLGAALVAHLADLRGRWRD